MAIYYVDPVNGNNANTALSYAQAVQTPLASALSSVTGGDEVRFAESTVVDTGFDSTWTLMQGAQAGGINITAATNATPIQITVAAAHGMSTGDWVFISGVLGNTYANGMWRITKVDNTNFTLIGSAGNAAYTSGGAMRRRNGSVIPLPSGSVKSISMCGNNGQTVYPYNCANWTASTNVTCALNTTNTHQGNVNQSITLLTAFTGGKVAYQALGSAQDFSAYQAISFSLMTTTLASLPNNQFYIALCSDTAGNTIVDTFFIPDTTSSFGTGLLGNSIYAMKYHIARDGGGNLGSSIQSVALYTVGDPSNPVLQLDNIVAVKALSDTKCISVQHLVSNGIVADGYWGLGAVWNDAEIGPVGTFDTAGVTIGTAASPYWAGTNGVARLYTILPYNVGSVGSTSTDIYTIPFNSSTTPITISGGWSVASSMSTKTGRTCYATRNGGGRLFALSSKNGFQWSSFIIGYCAIGINMSGNYGTSFTDMHFYGCNSNGISQTNTLQLRNGVDFSDVAGTCTFTTCGTGMTQTSCFGSINKNLNVLGNSNIGMTLTTNTSSLFDNCKFQGTAQNQVVSVTSGLNKFTNCQFNYGNYGLQCSSNGAGNLIKNCSFNNNATAGCYFTGAVGSTVQGCTFGANNQNILAASASQGATVIGCNLGGDVATPFYLSGVSNMNLINCNNAGALASSWAPASTVVNYQNCSNNGSTIYFTASTELYNAVLKTTSGSSDTRSPGGGTSTGGVFISSPNRGAAGSRGVNNKGLYNFGQINCTANKLTTVSGWLRSGAGDGNDFCQLVVLGGTISGVSTNVESTATSNNSWIKHSISFTPTENSVVPVFVQYWGSNASGFYCDGMAVTIAP